MIDPVDRLERMAQIYSPSNTDGDTMKQVAQELRNLRKERDLYRSLLTEVADNVATKIYPVPKGLYFRIERALQR